MTLLPEGWCTQFDASIFPTPATQTELPEVSQCAAHIGPRCAGARLDWAPRRSWARRSGAPRARTLETRAARKKVRET